MASGLLLSQRPGVAGTSITQSPRQAPEARVGQLIADARQIHARLWAERLGAGTEAATDTATTPAQYTVLTALAGSSRIDHRLVEEMASLERREAADVVRRLEQRGWLSRARSPGDGRRTQLSSTVRGQGALCRASTASLRVDRTLLRRVPAAQRDETRRTLTQLAYGSATRFPGMDSSTASIALRLSTDVGHLLRRAAHIHADLWAAEFGPAMSVPEYEIVIALLDVGVPLDLAGLARITSLDRTRVSPVTRELHKRGWLYRVRDEHDARRLLMELTPRAAQAGASLVTRYRCVADKLMAPLGDAERTLLLGALAAVTSGEKGPSRDATDYGRGAAHRPRRAGEARVPHGRAGTAARAG